MGALRLDILDKLYPGLKPVQGGLSIKEKTRAGKYMFGFNGMEKDNETYGVGNEYDFGARIYDPRLGRWWGVDALANKHPDIAPYVYTANNPIFFVDRDGEDFIVHDKKTQRQVMRILKQTFGKTHGFTFKGSLLVHNGSKYYGSPDQNMVFSYFNEQIVGNTNINYTFLGFNYEGFTAHDGIYYDIGPSNALTVTSVNADKSLTTTTAVSYFLRSALRDPDPSRDEGVKSNKASVFWHEVGHPIGFFITGLNKDEHNIDLNAEHQRWTVGFENVVRHILFRTNQFDRSGKNHGLETSPNNTYPPSKGSDDFKFDNYDVRPETDEEKNTGHG